TGLGLRPDEGRSDLLLPNQGSSTEQPRYPQSTVRLLGPPDHSTASPAGHHGQPAATLDHSVARVELIGYGGAASTPLTMALAGIAGEYDVVFGWSSAACGYTVYFTDPNKAALNTASVMQS